MKPDIKGWLNVEIYRVGDVTVAEVIPPQGETFRGASKRHPDDPQNSAIGNSLATARALREYADHLKRAAFRASHDR